MSCRTPFITLLRITLHKATGHSYAVFVFALPTAIGLLLSLNPTAVPVAATSVHLYAEPPEPDPSWDVDEPEEETGNEVDPLAEDPDGDDGAIPPGDATDASQTDVVASAEVVPTPAPSPDEVIIPERKGLALAFTAGGLGALGWGMMGVRIARIKRLCTGDEIDTETVNEDTIGDVTGSAANCFIAGRGANALLWVVQALPNSANWGLAPAAATIRAKYDAARDFKSGAPQRPSNVFIGTGAAVMGAGIIGRLVVMVIKARSLNPTNGIAAGCLEGGEVSVDRFFSCYADRNALYYGLHQLTSASVAGGAAMLAYGVVYKRERKAMEKKYTGTTALEFSMAPQVSLNYTGLNAQLRF